MISKFGAQAQARRTTLYGYVSQDNYLGQQPAGGPASTMLYGGVSKCDYSNVSLDTSAILVSTKVSGQILPRSPAPE